MALRCGLAILFVLTTACGGGNATSDSAAETNGLRPNGDPVAQSEGAPTRSSEPTAYQHLAGTTDEEGRIPLDQALSLFALQYGELPGAAVPPGDPGPAMSGDIAIDAVFDNWDELSPQQRDAVLTALDLPADFDPGAPNAPGPIEEPVPTTRGRSATSRLAADLAPYRSAVDQALAHQERRFGPLGASVVVVDGGRTYGVESGRAAADTLVLNPATCRIRVFLDVLPPPDGPNFALAHEVAHCFQQLWTPQHWSRAQSWVIEGGANWVAAQTVAELGGSDTRLLSRFLLEYVQSPRTTLFRRTYSGVGFFATVAERSGPMWDRMRSAVEATSPRAAYEAVTGALADDPALADLWATSQVGRPELGARWLLDAPGVPSVTDPSTLEYPPLAAGASREAHAAQYATVQLAARLRAPVTRIGITDGTYGTARLDGRDRPVDELSATSWCTDPNGRCTCPAGTRRAGQQIPRLDGSQLLMAISGGGASAGTATVSGRTLEEECEQVPLCPVGEWTQTSVRLPQGTELVSGGSGTRVTIDESGGLVQDFSGTAPMTTRSRLDGAAVLGAAETVTLTHLAPTGTLTARVELAPDRAANASAPLTDVDASAMGGTAWIETLGTRVDLSITEIMGIATGLAADRRFATPAPPPEVICGADTLTLRAGGQEQIYEPTGG